MSFTVTIKNKSSTLAFGFLTVWDATTGVVTRYMPPLTAGVSSDGLTGSNNKTNKSLVLPANSTQTLTVTASAGQYILFQSNAVNDATSPAIFMSKSCKIESGKTGKTYTLGGYGDYGLYIVSGIVVAIFFALLLVVFILLVRAAMKNSDS